MSEKPMKAVILVGGFGTRLRPLTLSIPKPLVQFANEHMLIHQIKALRAVGVTEVILAINYQPDTMRSALDPYQNELGVKIRYSQEMTPLGTAGPIALAHKNYDLGSSPDDPPFIVLNSDITCSFPFKDLKEFHEKHGAEGTIMVTKVTDPSKYGVVCAEDEAKPGRITRFVEKPQTYVGNMINAGIYIFKPSILNRIELTPTSIERDVFPKMAAEEQLYRMELEGHWMDVGQPKDFLTGTGLYLQHLRQIDAEKLAESAQLEESQIVGDVLIDPSAKIGKGCMIGPSVTIGKGCKVGDGVRMKNCVLLEGVQVSDNAYLDRSIVGWGSRVGAWVRMEGNCVLGEDVQITAEKHVSGAVVLPHKVINQNVPEARIIM